MTERTADRPHYPSLDGLRGLAILLVLIYHNFEYTNYFFFGWLGVDLFFVLSGFLITDILLKDLGQKNFLGQFYIRRILRIFPLYYFSLTICLFVLPNIKNLRLDVSFYINNQVWLWTYIQNWLFIFKTLHGSKILLHFWSLAVEEQFYIIWPFIILLVRKPKWLLLIVTIILLSIATGRIVLWGLHIKTLAYSNLYMFSRIDGICIGCMLALALRINQGLPRKYLPIIILFFGSLNLLFYFINRNYSDSIPFLGAIGYTTFAALFGFLVYEAILGKIKIISIIFKNSILIFLGNISYGLYVYHWPIYLLLFPYLKDLYYNITGISKLSTLASAITVSLLAIAISFLSYRYFESYFLKLKKKFV